jgi:hypothetical protein
MTTLRVPHPLPGSKESLVGRFKRSMFLAANGQTSISSASEDLLLHSRRIYFLPSKRLNIARMASTSTLIPYFFTKSSRTLHPLVRDNSALHDWPPFPPPHSIPEHVLPAC